MDKDIETVFKFPHETVKGTISINKSSPTNKSINLSGDFDIDFKNMFITLPSDSFFHVGGKFNLISGDGEVTENDDGSHSIRTITGCTVVEINE